jgi:PleD family two-component response regulator
LSKILIVDDDVDILSNVSEALEMEGFITVCATNSWEAWALLVSDPPDLVILDVGLPKGPDGFDLCRMMQSHPKLSAVPVVMLTARSSSADIATGYRIGADDYILKPIDANELVLRIRSQLHHLYHDDVSELTGLPGPRAAADRLLALRSGPSDDAVVTYVDISNFSAYNLAYGWAKGNDVILLLARLLQQWARQHTAFVAHLGGDNFVAVSDRIAAGALVSYLPQHFQSEMKKFYSAADLERGYLLIIGKKGIPQYIPLLQLRIDLVEP